MQGILIFIGLIVLAVSGYIIGYADGIKYMIHKTQTWMDYLEGWEINLMQREKERENGEEGNSGSVSEA